MPIDLFTHPDFFTHPAPPSFPERPARLTAILDRLTEQGLTERCQRPTFEPATTDQITRLHTPDYVTRAQHACETGQPQLDCPDVPIGPTSEIVARLATGAALTAIDRLINHTATAAFLAARPPGHHAEADRAMGFCIYNHAALAAEHAIQHHHLQRVAILDFDVHHGNGTQHLFESRPDVFYCSLHEDPRTQYPGTGHPHETGIGPGLATTLNLPLPAGTTDDHFLQTLTAQAIPALQRFDPQLLILSAGFDAHTDDPLGHLNLSTGCFTQITQHLLALNLPTLSVLEGGYHLDALADCVQAHLTELLNFET
ncbi:MAG: histone deacetylase [Planctomycetota bacterium]